MEAPKKGAQHLGAPLPSAYTKEIRTIRIERKMEILMDLPVAPWHTAHPPWECHCWGAYSAAGFKGPLPPACRKEILDNRFERGKEILKDLPVAPWGTQPTLPIECHY